MRSFKTFSITRTSSLTDVYSSRGLNVALNLELGVPYRNLVAGVMIKKWTPGAPITASSYSLPIRTIESFLTLSPAPLYRRHDALCRIFFNGCAQRG